MKVAFECLYCGHIFKQEVYNLKYVTDKKCQKCGDSQLIGRDLSKASIDYYQGSPPFSDKDLKKIDDYYDSLMKRFAGKT